MSHDIYDTGYPTKPMGSGNPYYACVYCGRTDPQINGKIKNHSSSCEYRLFMEFGTPLTHDGFGNIIPEEVFSWEEKEEILKAEGWTVLGQDPLVIVDKKGEKLSGFLADSQLMIILDEYQS